MHHPSYREVTFFPENVNRLQEHPVRGFIGELECWEHSYTATVYHTNNGLWALSCVQRQFEHNSGALIHARNWVWKYVHDTVYRKIALEEWAFHSATKIFHEPQKSLSKETGKGLDWEGITDKLDVLIRELAGDVPMSKKIPFINRVNAIIRRDVLGV